MTDEMRDFLLHKWPGQPDDTLEDRIESVIEATMARWGEWQSYKYCEVHLSDANNEWNKEALKLSRTEMP